MLILCTLCSQRKNLRLQLCYKNTVPVPELALSEIAIICFMSTASSCGCRYRKKYYGVKLFGYISYHIWFCVYLAVLPVGY